MLTESWGDCLGPSDVADNWIWTGLLRPGQITLITAPPKTGKTTLLSHLLAHRQNGTPLLDRPVRARRLQPDRNRRTAVLLLSRPAGMHMRTRSAPPDSYIRPAHNSSVRPDSYIRPVSEIGPQLR